MGPCPALPSCNRIGSGAAPDLGSVVWWPARAVLGDTTALALVLGAALVLFLASIAVFRAVFRAACAGGREHLERRRKAGATGRPPSASRRRHVHAAKGMDLAAARSLARVADHDAAALPAAARVAAVAELRRGNRRARALRAGLDHGERTTRRRSRLARHFRRGRARSRRRRADHRRASCAPKPKRCWPPWRSCSRPSCRARLRLAFCRAGHGVRHPAAAASATRFNSASARRPNEANSDAARPLRASRPSPRRSPRSAGRRRGARGGRQLVRAIPGADSGWDPVGARVLSPLAISRKPRDHATADQRATIIRLRMLSRSRWRKPARNSRNNRTARRRSSRPPPCRCRCTTAASESARRLR